MRNKVNTTPAVILGLLLPGAGHWYAGKGGRGLLWFAAVTLVAFAGFSMLGPQYYAAYRTDFVLWNTKISLPVAIPEIGNFLETWAAIILFGIPVPDAPLPAVTPFGHVLAAAAGIMNVMAASEAHYLFKYKQSTAPRFAAGKSPGVAALLGWVVPGLGHVWLGRGAKGLLGGGVLILTFVTGVVLAGGTNVQRERDLYFWSAEILTGAPAAAATILDFGRRVQHPMPLAELGLLFTSVAGLLNILLVLDAYATAERDATAQESNAAAPESAASSPNSTSLPGTFPAGPGTAADTPAAH